MWGVATAMHGLIVVIFVLVFQKSYDKNPDFHNLFEDGGLRDSVQWIDSM